MRLEEAHYWQPLISLIVNFKIGQSSIALTDCNKVIEHFNFKGVSTKQKVALQKQKLELMKTQKLIRNSIQELKQKQQIIQQVRQQVDISAALKKRFRPDQTQIMEEDEEDEPDAEDRNVYQALGGGVAAKE